MAATPSFSPASGTTFTSTLSVTLSDSTPSATIQYTTDGSTPNTSSTIYTGPISLNATTTIKAIATANGYQQSAVGSATYTQTSSPPGAPVSDDFNGGSLNTSLWTASSPAGGSVSVANGHAVLTVPSGSNHDAFVGGNNSVRILQNISNSDFDVAAKFDSTVNQQYEGEGILIQQNGSTYLRVEFTADGTRTAISAALVSNGSQNTFFSSTIPSFSVPVWIQVQRSGNTFIVTYSNDGTTYQSGGTFTQSITVNAIGPYAWNYNANSSSAPALTALVDYFYNLAGTSPPPVAATPTFNPASGTTFTSTLSVMLSDTTPNATIYYTTNGSTPSTSSTVYSGPITLNSTTTVKAIATASGYQQSNVGSATYTLTSLPVAATPTFGPASGTTFTSTLSVTLSDTTVNASIYYTTDGSTPSTTSALYSGPFTISATTTVKAIATASGYQQSATGTATYTLSSGAPGAPVSDDFNGSSLNTSLWAAAAPAGGSVTVSGGHALLNVPGGSNHDAFVGGNNSVRIFQNIANSDFDVAAKFDTAVKGQYQGEGILVQQSSSVYPRCEITTDGSLTYISAALVTNCIQNGFFTKAISVSQPVWLQVQRSGNTWTLSYSTDGTNYTTGGPFTQSLTANAIGPYAWNYNATPSASPAITAAVDYFYNLATCCGGNPPVISSVLAGNLTQTSAVVSWTTDKAASSTVNYGTTTNYGSSVSSSTLTTSHSLSLTGLTCNTLYNFDVSSTASGQTATSGNFTFTTSSCTSGGAPVSDNFDEASLNTNLWTIVNPLGDGVVSMNGTAVTLNVPQGQVHDPNASANNALQLMQKISNVDFEIVARFQSSVQLAYQDQGIIVQQTNTTFV